TRAVALTETAVGPNAPSLVILLNLVAGMQRSLGREADAQQTYRRAIAISEAAVGHDHPLTALVMDSLGALFSAMDDYVSAEPILLEAQGITERTLGQHPRLATELMTLALQHTRRGDYSRAHT